MFMPTKELGVTDGINITKGLFGHDGEYILCYLMHAEKDDLLFAMYYKENTPENLEHFKQYMRDNPETMEVFVPNES